MKMMKIALLGTFSGKLGWLDDHGLLGLWALQLPFSRMEAPSKGDGALRPPPMAGRVAVNGAAGELCEIEVEDGWNTWNLKEAIAEVRSFQ